MPPLPNIPPPRRRRRKRWPGILTGFALAASLVPTVAAIGLIVVIERMGPPPLERAGVKEVSTQVLDRNGTLLRPFTTAAGRWRLPADVEETDPDYIALLLAYEDKRFFSHRGVDPLAVGRALWQAATRGRVVSGASTITMQLARLIEPREERSLAAKFHEMVRALQIEATLSKREILELYLTLAPFGGNLEGIRAASLSYFGKEPRRLALHEAALLVALPQSPELRRPDRFPEAARAARRRVLERAVAAGLITPAEAAAAAARPVPTQRRAFPMHAAHLAQDVVSAQAGRTVHRLTIDRDLQSALERIAAQHAYKAGPAQSVAILLVEHASGEVLAHVGSADFFDARRAGQIDMARAIRSPGSALKPFVYGLAFERGLAHPETLIEDRPTRFGSYAPRNFDRDFQGTVSVREALQHSLNLPAVQVLEAVGPERFLARLRAAGAQIALPDWASPGLAVVLGGAGLRLVDLAQLYAGLARGGAPVTLRWSLDEPHGQPPPERLLAPIAAWYVGDILRGTPPPAHAAGGAIAFKTGTSYGYRDAWAVGFDGRYTAAVWVGRPDGGASPGLSGIGAAAPLLFDVFARLGPSRAPLGTPPPDAVIASTAELPPPLREFGAALNASRDAGGPRIAFPPDGARVEVTGSGDGLALKVDGGTLPLTWLMNGRPLSAAQRQRLAFWQPDGEGFAELTVLDARGRASRTRFRVDLRP